MQKFYIAFCCLDYIASKGYAAVMTATEQTNLLRSLDDIPNIRCARLCKTQKEASNLVKQWNKEFTEIGVYAY